MLAWSDEAYVTPMLCNYCCGHTLGVDVSNARVCMGKSKYLADTT